jgi:hypothetical protein
MFLKQRARISFPGSRDGRGLTQPVPLPRAFDFAGTDFTAYPLWALSALFLLTVQKNERQSGAQEQHSRREQKSALTPWLAEQRAEGCPDSVCNPDTTNSPDPSSLVEAVWLLKRYEIGNRLSKLLQVSSYESRVDRCFADTRKRGILGAHAKSEHRYEKTR